MNPERRSEELIVVLRAAHPGDARYSLGTAAALTGVPEEMLEQYCRMGLLGEARVEEGPRRVFDDEALYEIRRIEYFRRYHGVNLHALPFVYRLAGEIERLSGEIRTLRHRNGR
jgi:hypothetical protein